MILACGVPFENRQGVTKGRMRKGQRERHLWMMNWERLHGILWCVEEISVSVFWVQFDFVALACMGEIGLQVQTCYMEQTGQDEGGKEGPTI